jgi:hypothetical protein
MDGTDRCSRDALDFSSDGACLILGQVTGYPVWEFVVSHQLKENDGVTP